MLETPLDSSHHSLGNSMRVWDNQQATKVGWFVGILEGEGTFDLRSNCICISNLDLSIIESCEKFLKSHNIWFVRDTFFRNGRNEYVLRVSNSGREIFQYATLLYELILPSLECRLNEYQQLIGASTTTRDPSIDLDWLTGIFEAEGSFSLTLDYRKNAALAISMNNTNERIINKVTLNLDSICCGYHIRDKVKRKSHFKTAQIISVTGMKRCYKFLSLMEGKWISKRYARMADSILTFINSRLSHSYLDPYTERELRLIQSTIDLNR